MLKNTILPIFLSMAWISLNEFARNQLVLVAQWKAHYASLGMTWPEEPIRGAIWGIWALVFSIVIYFIAQRSTLLRTAALAWVVGFVMMWLVIGNLQVLPMDVLPIAVPWSMVEALGACWIIHKLSAPAHAQ